MILAEAQRDGAEECAATAMPRASRSMPDAFGQDKEFFAFYRSMQAYRDALNGRTTSFVLTPDSGFLPFLRELRRDGGQGSAPTAAPVQ